MNQMFESGLNILRREARELPADDWKSYEDLMRRVEQHVIACGGDWERHASAFKRELAEIMRL